VSAPKIRATNFLHGLLNFIHGLLASYEQPQSCFLNEGLILVVLSILAGGYHKGAPGSYGAATDGHRAICIRGKSWRRLPCMHAFRKLQPLEDHR